MFSMVTTLTAVFLSSLSHHDSGIDEAFIGPPLNQVCMPGMDLDYQHYDGKLAPSVPSQTASSFIYRIAALIVYSISSSCCTVYAQHAV
jgi:hypothetical protein